VTDLLFILLTLFLFVLSAAWVRACEKF